MVVNFLFCIILCSQRFEFESHQNFSFLLQKINKIKFFQVVAVAFNLYHNISTRVVNDALESLQLLEHGQMQMST